MKEPLSILNLPLDENSSYMRGPALAPPLIKDAFYCDSANLCCENNLDLGSVDSWRWEVDGELDSFSKIEFRVEQLIGEGRHVISLGGDHSVTLPVIRAHSRCYEKLNILHLDAHPDLYDNMLDNPGSHASPFARIMEDKLAVRLVQVGIRTMNPHQRAQAERFGTEVIDMRHIDRATELSFDGPLYLSLDLDCLDPAFAPGLSHHEPGGMTTREVLTLIQNLKGPLIGADIVEYNPKRDINGVTAMVAAKLLKEIMARMMENEGS